LIEVWIGYTKLYRKDKVMVFLKRRGEGGNHDPKKSRARVQRCTEESIGGVIARHRKPYSRLWAWN